MRKQKSKAYRFSLNPIAITVIVALILTILNASIVLVNKGEENIDDRIILLEIVRAIMLNWSYSAIGSAIFSICKHSSIVESLINKNHINRFPLANSITGGLKYGSNVFIAIINLVLAILLYTNNGISNTFVVLEYIISAVFFFMSIISMVIVEVQIKREKDYCQLCDNLKINHITLI